MNLFALNILLASIWLLLAEKQSVPTFIIGFIIGFIMIAIFSPLFKSKKGKTTTVFSLKKDFYRDSGYIKRTLWFVYFCVWFTKEFLVANIKIAWAVLAIPNSKINPNIFTYDIKDLTTFEIIMLSQCITLTPGTTTVEVSKDENTLFVHAFDCSDPQKERDSLTNGLVKEIQRFTR